jgi:hypothetical protein
MKIAKTIKMEIINDSLPDVRGMFNTISKITKKR